jgi:hypothetical protein
LNLRAADLPYIDFQHQELVYNLLQDPPMFAKAPRFTAATDSGVPGPAAYTILSPENRKKGAFLEKDRRFKDVQNNGVGAHVALLHPGSFLILFLRQCKQTELAPANDDGLAVNRLKASTNTNSNEIAKHRVRFGDTLARNIG